MTNRLIIVLTILVPLFSLGQAQSDTLDKKKGKWIFFGKSKSDTLQRQPLTVSDGLHVHYRADSTRWVEGMYENNMKSGTWTYYYNDGKTISGKVTYVANRREGPYEKYYQDGTIKESGYYESDKRKVLIARYFPSGCLEYEAHHDEASREEGKVRFYYDCDSINTTIGQIEFEYTAVSGNPVGKATRYYENGKIKEIIEYGIDGRVISREEKK